jgi:hypothetical protein
MIPDSSAPKTNGLFARLSEQDRQRFGEAWRRLLVHGSILGLEPSQMELYHWSYQNREWLDDLATLLDFKLFWDHQERTIQAVPQTTAFLLKLKLDATLVLFTLWYEFDTAVRDRGETPPIRLTVQELNDSLKTKFEPLQKNLPSLSRLTEILALGQRKNLLRFASEIPFEKSVIEVLPTLKRVIPFQTIDEWNKHADRFLAAAKEAPQVNIVGEADSTNDDAREAE